MKAYVKFEDAAGKTSLMRLNGLDDEMTTPGTALGTFVTAIQTYFNAIAREYYVLVEDSTDLSIAAQNVAYQSSLHKGLVTLGFAVGDETHYRGLWIPAPNLLRFELVANVGYRMDAASLTALLTAINLASDTTHTIRQGVLEFREGRQAKPSEGGYLVMTDYLSRPAYLRIPDVSDKTKLATLAATLGAETTGFTTAGISKAVVLSKDGGVNTGDATEEDGYDSVALRYTMRFSWEISNKLHEMSLNAPALKSTSVITPSGADASKRTVTQTCGDAVATALTTLYGDTVRDLTFIEGRANVKN
jgi:hypothetical protein